MFPTQMRAIAGEVEMAIDEVLEIAKSTVSRIEDTAQNQAARPFRDMQVDRAAFSEVPAAQDLAGQHEAAQQVFMETIEGVVTDLAEFKQRLLDSARTMQERDQSAEQMLLALGRSYQGHQFASDTRFDQSRGEYAEDLAAPEEKDAGGGQGDGQTRSVAGHGEQATEGNESL